MGPGYTKGGSSIPGIYFLSTHACKIVIMIINNCLPGSCTLSFTLYLHLFTVEETNLYNKILNVFRLDWESSVKESKTGEVVEDLNLIIIFIQGRNREETRLYSKILYNRDNQIPIVE